MDDVIDHLFIHVCLQPMIQATDNKLWVYLQ